MPSAVDTLVEMGFSRQHAELAIRKAGGTDVQNAMDWLLSHEGELDGLLAAEAAKESSPAPQQPMQTESPLAAPSNAEVVAVAKSIQCDDCGKLFKTQEEVEFHASKSGHENFSESTEEKKALSEDEKKEQLAKIEAKLKLRRLEREAREKEEALLREKNRIKSGKELLEAKKKHEEQEMKKIVEQRRREKEEDRLAKQRVKEQIEQDRLARKAKFGGGATHETPQTIDIPKPVEASSNPPGTYSEVVLQIRMLNGEALTQKFGAKEPLSVVRVFIEMNQKDIQTPFKLMTNYPKRVFENDEYEKPLEALGLAPRATLIVSKCV